MSSRRTASIPIIGQQYANIGPLCPSDGCNNELNQHGQCETCDYDHHMSGFKGDNPDNPGRALNKSHQGEKRKLQPGEANKNKGTAHRKGDQKGSYATIDQQYDEEIGGFFQSLKRASAGAFRGARRMVKKGAGSLGSSIASANASRKCNKLQGRARSECHANRRSADRDAKKVRQYKYHASKAKETLRQLYNKLKDAASNLDKTEDVVERFIDQLNEAKQSVDATQDGEDEAEKEQHAAHVKAFQRLHVQLPAYTKKWMNAVVTYGKYLQKAQAKTQHWKPTKQPSACNGNAACAQSSKREQQRGDALNTLVKGAREKPTRRIKFENDVFSFE